MTMPRGHEGHFLGHDLATAFMSERATCLLAAGYPCFGNCCLTSKGKTPRWAANCVSSLIIILGSPSPCSLGLKGPCSEGAHWGN